MTMYATNNAVAEIFKKPPNLKAISDGRRPRHFLDKRTYIYPIQFTPYILRLFLYLYVFAKRQVICACSCEFNYESLSHREPWQRSRHTPEARVRSPSCGTRGRSNIN